MNEMQTAPAGWKKKIVHELIEYWINFGYLAFFLVAFIVVSPLDPGRVSSPIHGLLVSPDRSGGLGQGNHDRRSTCAWVGGWSKSR